MLRPTVIRPVCLSAKPHLGPKTRFLLLWDSCGFVDVGRPLWREDGSAVYNCCWLSPAQSFLVRVLRDWWPYFSVTYSRLPQPGGPGPRIYIPQEQRSPVISPGSEFPFRRLLWLARLRWNYSNPHPRGAVVSVTARVSVTVISPLVVYRQFLRFGAKPLEIHDIFFWTEPLRS
jgi:hypothetical protein